jgi:hypothetical protein
MKMKKHILKCDSEYFLAVTKGIKTFEIRKNDRGFICGDTIVLAESVSGKETGRRSNKYLITFILRGGQYGLLPGYIAMQLRELKTPFSTIGEKRKGTCPKCLQQTVHECMDIDPDKPGEHSAWQCVECGELLEIET